MQAAEETAVEASVAVAAERVLQVGVNLVEVVKAEVALEEVEPVGVVQVAVG